MKMFLMINLMFFSFIMIFLNHPLSLGMMILLQTLILCLLSSFYFYSYWFSYILFLIFMGGILILFIYISSIASNEIFKFNSLLKINLIIYPIIMLIISFIYNKLYIINNMMNLDMNNMFNMFLFFNSENNINLSKLYNKQTYFLMMMMIIYLFITLIAVIKITNILFGPLRSFYY